MVPAAAVAFAGADHKEGNILLELAAAAVVKPSLAPATIQVHSMTALNLQQRSSCMANQVLPTTQALLYT